ncbi:MAG: DinB family protein [Dehalococcoidia bacterium]
MDPESERIRSYLQTQAKLTIPQLVGKVRNDMQQVQDALESVPPALFGARPAEREWSANEVAAHLASTSAAVAGGIRRAIDDGEAPEAIADTMEKVEGERSANEWWQALHSGREALLEHVLKASGEESLGVKWEHGTFGDLHWREWLLFLRIHDLDHARQIEAIAAALQGSPA